MARIDLNRAATFVRVVEAGTFTAAAAGVGLPTSSVSRSVARLEDDLGVRLLHRTTRKLNLTEAGAQYFKRMQAVLHEAGEAAAAAAGHAQEPQGMVRLTAPHDFGPVWLPIVMAELLRRHPGLQLDIMLTGRRVDLVEEGIDLAVRGGRLEDSSLVARKIGATDLGIFASPSYLQRRGRPRGLADLARHECVRFRGRQGLLPWRFTGPGGEPEEVAVSGPVIADDMGFVYQLALEGVGLVMLPAERLRDDLEKGRLVRVLPRYAVRGGALYVLWPSQRLLPARVVLVRDFLTAELGKAF
jgi:DNA-binding transcriptional LysR family regulator